MRYRLLFFLIGIIFYSSCQKTIREWATDGTCVLKNSTNHKIETTFYYNGGHPNKIFVIEKNSMTTVEKIGLGGGGGGDGSGYVSPYYYADYSPNPELADSISVLYDQSVLIRHYRDTLKRAVKSYNRNSDRSLFNKDSYIRTISKHPKANDDMVNNVQLLYTFTEEDYLFAK